MFIKDGKRFNIYPKYTDPDTGESGIDLTILNNRIKYGIDEIPDPVRASDETHYNQEIDDAPYLISTPKSEEQLTSLRHSKVKTIREELTENGGCFVAGKWFHTDTKSKQQQLALFMLGSNMPGGLQWKTMDGTFITMSESLASQIFFAQVAREQAIFAIAEAKRNNPNDTTAWPARYEP